MAVQFKIPHQSRFIVTTNIIEAQFNIPVIGKYSFNIPQNRGQHILELSPNTIYLLERMTVGGDIPEGVYLSAIEEIPYIKFKRKINDEILYKQPIPIVNYIDDQDIVAWVKSDKGNDSLILDVSGLLQQTALLVGVSRIRIHISLSIYAIESTVYSREFRDTLKL